MATHQDYPELVKIALISNLYWQHSEDLAFIGGDLFREQDAVLAYRSLKTMRRINRDTQMASRIGSVVTSAEASGTLEQIPWGEQLPIPHGRQVIKVIEDSRVIHSKLSPSYQLVNNL